MAAEQTTPIGNEGFVTDLDIRIWLRDNDKAANLLIDDFEFTPEEIRTAWTMTVDYWNDQPPYIGCYNIKSFPWRSKLISGTAANLLFIAAHRFRRNALKYQAGGAQIADQDKYQEYDAAGARIWQEYKDWVVANKRAINAERGWGIIS